MSVKRLLKNRAEKRRQFNRISSRDTAAAVSSISLLPHQIAREGDLEDFREWKSDYDEGYRELWDRIEEWRGSYHDRYQEQLQKEFGPELSEADLGRSTLQESPDIDSIIESARGVGTKGKLEFWQFFARKGGSSAQDQLRYIGDSGNPQYLSDEQFATLREGGTISDILPSGQRHHIRSVSASLENSPTDISDATDPDNIRIMTRESHLNDPLFGHGGDWQNQTTGDVNTVDRDYQNVAEQRYEDEVLTEADERAEEMGIAAGLIGGSIRAIVQYQKLRRKPWRNKSLALASSFAKGSLEFGGVAYVAMTARDETAQLINQGTFDAAETMAEVGTDLITDLLASGSAVSFAVAARSTLKLARQIKQGRSVKTAADEFGKDIIVVAGEEGTFILLGMATDVATPIPEPTINAVITTLRITYRLGKVGYNYRQNILSRRECKQRRLNTLHAEALEVTG